jgi:hypothetical protein
VNRACLGTAAERADVYPGIGAAFFSSRKFKDVEGRPQRSRDHGTKFLKAGEFFYYVARTSDGPDTDGFFLVAVPRNQRHKVMAEANGFRSLRGRLRRWAFRRHRAHSGAFRSWFYQLHRADRELAFRCGSGTHSVWSEAEPAESMSGTR